MYKCIVLSQIFSCCFISINVSTEVIISRDLRSSHDLDLLVLHTMEAIIDSTCANELIRIGTFVGWPGSDVHCKVVKPSAIDMARNGFYFTGSSDEVSASIELFY